jgi:hypothetical protein
MHLFLKKWTENIKGGRRKSTYFSRIHHSSSFYCNWFSFDRTKYFQLVDSSNDRLWYISILYSTFFKSAGNQLHPTTKENFFKEGDQRREFCQPILDPRIHFALNCGAKVQYDLLLWRQKSIGFIALQIIDLIFDFENTVHRIFVHRPGSFRIDLDSFRSMYYVWIAPTNMGWNRNKYTLQTRSSLVHRSVSFPWIILSKDLRWRPLTFVRMMFPSV